MLKPFELCNGKICSEEEGKVKLAESMFSETSEMKQCQSPFPVNEPYLLARSIVVIFQHVLFHFGSDQSHLYYVSYQLDQF